MPDIVTAPTIEVAGLTISTRGHAIVEDLSFNASAGVLTWIVGENGAGKSSLLRMLATSGDASAVTFSLPRQHSIAYYTPSMGVPAHTTVAAWLRFNGRVSTGREVVLDDVDPILPRVTPQALLSRLSTGEAKRLLLWSLLREHRPFTILDEPYEHLSPKAKVRLTDILVTKAARGVVIVATNQMVPDIPNKQILEIA